MTVELFGMARALAGVPAIDVPLAEPATLRSVAGALAAARPQLVPTVITPARDAFAEPNFLLLDGRRAVHGDDPITSADRPCVLFLASGG